MNRVDELAKDVELLRRLMYQQEVEGMLDVAPGKSGVVHISQKRAIEAILEYLGLEFAAGDGVVLRKKS